MQVPTWIQGYELSKNLEHAISSVPSLRFGRRTEWERVEGMEKQDDTSNVLLLNKLNLWIIPRRNDMPTGSCLERLFPWAMVKATSDVQAITTPPHGSVWSSSGSEYEIWSWPLGLKLWLFHLLPVKTQASHLTVLYLSFLKYRREANNGIYHIGLL